MPLSPWMDSCDAVSNWTHAICEDCWDTKHPGRPAVRLHRDLVDKTAPPCCYCGRPQQSGIFVRDNPAKLLCQGTGPNHSE
jgi:hypothetical protein